MRVIGLRGLKSCQSIHSPDTSFTSLFVKTRRIPQALLLPNNHSFFSRCQPSYLGMHPQAVEAPLTQSATFLVLSATDTPAATQKIRSAISSISGITKNVSARHTKSNLSCVVGIGSAAWDRLTGDLPRPSELHPFPEVQGAKHVAPSTPGDLLFHIRSDRRDLAFEFERQLMDLFGTGTVKTQDETVGFRYFDARDVLGFVDGTANPTGSAVPEAVLATASDDAAAAAGSYVVVQKYLHDLSAWRRLATEKQEAVIGRTKLDNIELEDAAPGSQQSHKSLATITDEDGEEHGILRDNMPFGSPASGEYGTYFIGYSKKLWVIEKMMERMFVGDPPGMHDRILDFSRPVTGTTFFVPSADVLASL